MMVIETIKEDPILWRHDDLLETGYEIGDLLSILLNMYPYRHDGMKDDLKVAFILHHLPGILLSAFVLEAGLHYNEHLRAIGTWLLLGACQTCIGGLYIYTLDFDKQMGKAAGVFLSNVAFFFFCRFIVFPREAYLLIKDVQASAEFQDTNLLKLLYFGGVSLSIFNLGVIADVLPKSIRYIKRAFDGVTPIETEPVPKSREERMKRRRSSITVFVDAVEDVVARRRSSFTTIMHLNVVEDIARLDREAVVSEEDLIALNKTISSLHANACKTE